MLTCQSEVGKVKSIFIKRAEDAFVNEDRISREWRNLNFLSKPSLPEAKSEYRKFEDILKSEIAEINLFPQDVSVSLDSIYCRDASIATDKGMILCNMGKPERTSEPDAQAKIFSALGISILGRIQLPGTVEGGDVVWLDERTLAVGHSYRTNTAGIAQLENLLQPAGVSVITVQLPHYRGTGDVFHLMSVLSPVDNDLAVVYSRLMPIIFRDELIRRKYKLVEVPDGEFESMGCNILAIAPRKCIMVKGNPETRSALEKAGARVWEYQGNEISLKGGGGPTCLTRPLLREV